MGFTYLGRAMIRSSKILKFAKGQTCTMQVPSVCNCNPETTVAAHSGKGEDGAGKGIKSHDVFIAYMCSSCHDYYDGRIQIEALKDDKLFFFHRAMKRTWLLLIDAGIIKIG